ncbi:hypothetical protein INR49_031798 [Caranx melampygus]|nr:hypothetical protein INR49_031798 [Caranx melampygus]
MPLGLKPCCAVCKTNSSSMWKKGNQGEILCNNCTGKSSSGGASGPSMSSSAQPSNGGGKQSKQEIHRRSARLRSTKYKAPASEKKVSTKGKGRRHIFKLKNGVYFQTGDVIKVTDEEDGKSYYAQIRGFVQDQYCEKSAALTWLIPTQASPKDHFDPGTYIVGPEEDLPRKMEYLEFVCHAPSEYFKSRSSPFPTIPIRPEKGYIWTHIGPTPALTIKESEKFSPIVTQRCNRSRKSAAVKPPALPLDSWMNIPSQTTELHLVGEIPRARHRVSRCSSGEMDVSPTSALKRRQSPEGGSPASSVQTCQGELERIHIHKGKLTETTPDRDKSIHLHVNKRAKKKKGHAGSHPVRSPHVQLTLLISTTQWLEGRPASPRSLLEVGTCQWGGTGTEEKGSPAGCMAIQPSLTLQRTVSSIVPTARGFAPGHKMSPRCLDTLATRSSHKNCSRQMHNTQTDTENNNNKGTEEAKR